MNMNGCDQTDHGYKLLNVAIIVLLLLILWYLMPKEKEEKYVGSGLSDLGVYTSGATLRRLGQMFGSTNQGVQTTIYNADKCVGSDEKCYDVGMHVIMYPLSRPQVLATPI